MTKPFIIEEFKNVECIYDKDEFYNKVVRILKRTKASDFLEFGTGKGATTKSLARGLRDGKRLYTFDWFKGLPKKWHNNADIGRFACDVPKFSNPRIIIVNGLFEKTLVSFVKKYPYRKKGVNFIHLDADLYSSTKYVLNTVWPLVNKGTKLLFDEFAHNSPMLKHEYRAWKEFVKERQIKYKYILRHKYTRVLLEIEDVGI